MISILAIFRKMSKDVDLDPFSVAYITRRLKNEGIRFATETLPKFSKLLLASLEAGHFLRKEMAFTSFAWKGALLKVFRGLLCKIFDKTTGVILPMPCPNAVLRLRQVCEYLYKLSLPFRDEQEEKAVETFKEVDASLASPYDHEWVDQLRKDFETYYPSTSRATICDVLKTHRPRAGSGTFSDKKYFEGVTRQPWYVRKDQDYALPRKYRGLGGITKPIKSAPMQREGISVDYSEVLFVPKDSRGPRTIVREPFGNLRVQMGFHDWLKGELERVTSHRVNFQDQQVNRDLARLSSLSRDWATLDLSSASDRVSARIISHIFRNSPAINYMVANRTKMTRLPNGEFLTLNKLSGMGSGLTFPLMSLLITLTITRALVNHSRMPYSQARKLVYVYGDDIIVPSRYTNIAVAALQAVKLEVARDKCYVKGPFRESCGGDYLNAVSVVPVRFKASSCEVSASGTFVRVEGNLSTIALERHCRELVKAGLGNLAEYYYTLLERRLGRLPYVSGDSPVLGRYVQDLPESWYPRDESGTFKSVKCWLAVADKREATKDPYIYLAHSLLRSVGSNFIVDGFSDSGSSINEVSIPRSVKYRYRKVSGLTLLG